MIRFNITTVESIRNDISKKNPACAQQFKILTYDLLPRFSIYIFDNTLMTVQSYAYERGEDTPCFLLQRQSQSGLFEFYATTARHIIENAKPFTSIT